MPPKKDKRKGGGATGGNNGTGGGGAGGVGRRTTRGHNASSTAGTGANGGVPSSGGAGSKRVSTTPKPSDGSGRSTNNSRGKRRLAANRTPTATVKRVTGKRVMTRGKKEKELTSFKDENGEVYKTGDFAYVDSQQPDLPHHICIIRDFKLDRKDSVVAEVKWFYRVSELPESVYHLLMQDRQNGDNAEMYKHPQMRERELFMAFNIDTHSASLFRGKCKVKLLNDVSDVATYLTEENSFFYTFGYKPESRRLTLRNEDIYIPHSQQAELPDCHLASPSPSSSSSPHPLSPSQRYSRPESRITNHEELVWKPHQLADDQLLMFLRAARSIALHAGVCMKGLITDGYLAASSDETTQQAFNTLHRNGHSTEKALQELVKRPTVGQLVAKRNWNKESTVLFAKGMRQFGKNFFKIQKELLPKKKIRELAEYYYHWKKTTPGLSSRNTRRQRKQTHIRLCRTMMKTREITPEREYMDWSSCDEDETTDEDGEKGQR
jgi:arginine-glutamic acid dipeptide repeat-containing protein